MPRLRLFDVRQSRLPETVGLCKSDVAGIAKITNSAERRLILDRAAGDTGWYGSWAKMVFPISITNPFITTPRGIARIIDMDLCQRPVEIENEFFEFLEFGNGLMPKNVCSGCNPFQLKHTFSRGEAPLFRDIDPGQYFRVIPTDDSDVGQRVLVQGVDTNGNTVVTEDVLNQVQGAYVVIALPYVDLKIPFAKITGLQKDYTSGVVQYQQVDPVSGLTVSLGQMDGGELVAGYPRYFVNGVPANCCNGVGAPSQVQVTAMVKLDHIDVFADTDYYVLHNLEALIAECQSIRYSEMDSTAAVQKAKDRHSEALGYLQGELVHYLGQDRPAVNLALWGSAHLSRQRIGSLI